MRKLYRTLSLYFAYGSNMAAERLASRVPAARKYANAELAGYCLRFHKVGADGSGKCDIVVSDSSDAVVYGALFSVQDADIVTLDRIEGNGYERISVVVSAGTDAMINAITYVATRTDPALHPFSWYREHVLRGAITNALPAAYIAASIASVACAEDPDRERHARELSVYK